MKLKLAILPGDGIGPEVVREGLKVIKAVSKRFNHELICAEALVGAAAIDAVGDPYPEATHKLCMESDAVFFGAIGHPKYDNDPSARIRPEQGLLRMRKMLGLYANVRPVSALPSLVHTSPLRADLVEGVDFVCIRELTGGLYFGRPQGRSEDGLTAYDTCVYSRHEVERIVRLAFGYAMRRRKKLTVVDKANVLATSRLWRQVAGEIAVEFPDVNTEYMFVDNAAMRIIQSPRSFDVIVTENMFGDILTDEASVIAGSLGLLPSLSAGLHTSVYEPIHGSYPQAAGKNRANPLASILSAALMFENSFGLLDEARSIREAVALSVERRIVTEDIAAGAPSFSTSEVGDAVSDFIVQNSDYKPPKSF
ncbi:MAG: 3-isopropylmalate dehydrogenase [Tannerellaceae bacterium]|jgi:3-isopropylmalate dehydrogenase|nr:3-isopropylmalate dehydrogenase [Tannerellaceae bacterium]